MSRIFDDAAKSDKAWRFLVPGTVEPGRDYPARELLREIRPTFLGDYWRPYLADGVLSAEIPDGVTLAKRLANGRALLTREEKGLLRDGLLCLYRCAITAIDAASTTPPPLLPGVFTMVVTGNEYAPAIAEEARRRAPVVAAEIRSTFEGIATAFSELADRAGGKSLQAARAFRAAIEADNPEGAINAAFAKVEEVAEDWTGATDGGPTADTPATGGKHGSRKRTRDPIPANCFQTQALLAAALETYPSTVSRWVKRERTRPQSFVWPFPKDDPKLLEEVKKEIRARDMERRAIGLARERGLISHRRKAGKERYNEALAAHNPQRQEAD